MNNSIARHGSLEQLCDETIVSTFKEFHHFFSHVDINKDTQMKLLFLLFLALFCCFTLTNVTADTDDPLADLEDPLDEEEEPQPKQEQQEQPKPQAQPNPQAPGISETAKIGWAVVIGASVIYLFRKCTSSSSTSSIRSSSSTSRTPVRKLTKSASVVAVTSKNELETCLQKTRVCLVDYGADWCGPCQECKPILHRIADDMSIESISFAVIEINVDTCSDNLGADIKTLPSFAIFVDGQCTGKYEGVKGLTLARRAARKAIQSLKKGDVVVAETVRKAKSGKTKTTKPKEEPLIDDTVTVDEQYRSTIESLVQTHRDNTNQPRWHCTAITKIDATDFDLHVELILCCGEMCQKKKFTVPRLQTADVSSSVSSTTSSTPQSKKTVDADVSDFLKVCNDNVATLSGDTEMFHLPIVTQTNTDKNQSSKSNSKSNSTSNSNNSTTAELPPGQPLHITTMEEFSSLSSRFPTVPIIVDFGASWCGPCRGIAPHFANLASQFGEQAIFIKVDTDESQSLSAAAGVQALPTFVFYRGGQEIDRMKGADVAGLNQKVNACLANGALSASSSSSETKQDQDQKGIDLSLLTTYESTTNLNRALATINKYNITFNKIHTNEADSVMLSVEEFNHVQQLVETLSKSNFYHASTIQASEIQVIEKMLLNWPLKYCLPVIDIVRVCSIHPDGISAMEEHASKTMWSVVQHATATTAATVNATLNANAGVALKCISNLVYKCTMERRSILNIQDRILQVCTSNIGKNDRRTVQALTSVMLNSIINVLHFNEQTEENMSGWIGIILLLLHREGKCKDATGLLVSKKCLSAFSVIASRASETCHQWLQIGQAVTTIKSSDFGINQLKKKLLDLVAALTQRKKSGIAKATAIPNPWA